LGALFLLCLLWASTSLRSDLLPGSVSVADASPFPGEALLLGLLAVVAAVVAMVRNAGWPRGRMLGAAVLVGIGLFVVPAALIEVAKGAIDDSTRMALFSLVPVLAVVFEPHLGFASSQQRGGLAAGLIAVLGSLLLFPLELPQNAHAALAFLGIVAAAASVAAANCMGVRIACEANAPSIFSFAAVSAGSGALILGAIGMLGDRRALSVPHLDAWSALDLVALGLLFWMMRRMTAVRMTTRFLIAPLLANLIGLAFLRPGVQMRGWIGLLLIAAGSGWLLLGPQRDRDESTLKLDLT
jgi:drug/metabolite transporter (DMT)-like permease